MTQIFTDSKFVAGGGVGWSWVVYDFIKVLFFLIPLYHIL